MKTLNFTKTIEALGYAIVPGTIARGYNHRSAFAHDKDGQLWYFHLEDLRMCPTFFKRTAKNTRDYTGGYNQIITDADLAALGIRLYQPRQACDYNRC